MRKLRRGLVCRPGGTTKQSSRDGKVENRLITLMAVVGVLLMVGYHSLAQSSSNSGSSGSGSCGSSAPLARTPSLGGAQQGALLRSIIGHGLRADRGVFGTALSAAVAADGPLAEGGDWRVIDEVFPFAGDPSTNPHSFVYEFQVKVSYTLTPGSAVYVGGRCYRNGTDTQETNERTFGVYLHTDEVLELKVSPGVGNDAQAQVLNYDYVGFRTCGGKSADGACGQYGLRVHPRGVNLALDFGLASPTSQRAGIKGTLRLVSEMPDAQLAHPSMLCYAEQPDSDVKVLRDSQWDGAIRQIKGADGVLEVRRDKARGYTLLHFPPDAVGVIGDDGFYQTTGRPYASWILKIGSDADPLDSEIVEIEQRIGEQALLNGGVTHRYVWVAANEGWDLIRGDGLVGDRMQVRWNAEKTIKEVTREQYDPTTGSLDRLNVTVYEKLIEGESALFKMREIANPGPDERVTTYDYGRNPGQVGYRQLTQVVDPNGGWVRYAYDEEDRVVRRWQGFLNQRPTDDWKKCRVTRYEYQPLPKSRDDGSQPGVARTEIVTLLGKEISRLYREVSGTQTWTYRSSNPGMAWDEKGNAVIRYETFGDGEFAGQAKSVTDARGRLTTYNYQLKDDQVITVQRLGVANKSGERVVKGLETTRINRRDGALLSIRQVDIETGILIEETNYREHDRLGRAQRIEYVDGSYQLSTRSDCCGVDFERKRDGTQISYSRDALGRVTSKLSGEQEERFVYDCAGEIIEWTLVDLTGQAPAKVKKQKPNLAGELEEIDDENGKRLFQTTLARAAFTSVAGPALDSPLAADELSGWQESETRADGSTVVRSFAADGHLLSLTGTAVHGLRYEYGVREDQGFWRSYTKTINLTRDGEDTHEFVLVFQDSLEQLYRTVYADGSEEQRFYDLDGQLLKSVDPDGITSLYETDLLGNVQTTALDLNRNGKIDWKGKDVISQSVRDYVIQAGKPATRTEYFVWVENRKDRSTRRSTRIESSDGLDVWQTRWLDQDSGATVHTRRRIQEDGREVETTTQADGSRTELVSFQSQIESSVQLDAEGNTVSRTDYQYNAVGQLIASADLRTGTTDYEYDERGNRVRILSPAPVDGAPRPETQFRYDAVNRVIETMHPDGGRVFTEYWSTGEKKLEHGVRTYPVKYDYDYAGRLKSMTTWQDYSGQQGRAETTWERDNRGQVIHKKYADGKGPRYTYTPAGRLATRIWARGVVTEYEYDAAGRLEKTTYSDETPKIERKYDRAGQLVEVKSGKNTTKLSYDAGGQLIREEGKGSHKFDLKRQYDDLGRPLGYQLKHDGASAQSRYEYDSAGRIAGVSDGEIHARYDYLPGSAMVSKLVTGSEEQPEQMVSTKSYDRLIRLTSIHHRTPKGVMASFDYTYNQANQRVEVRREDHSLWRYEYDRLGQVVFGGKFAPNAENGKLESIPGHGFSYGFDDIGNRRQSTKLDTPFSSETSASGAKSDYSANLLNQYVERTIPPMADLIGESDPRADLLARAEDENGKPLPLVFERTGSHFRVTAEVDNRQSMTTTSFDVEASLNGSSNMRSGSVTTPATPAVYSYDPDGNLLQDESWHYVWNGENRLIVMYNQESVAPEKRRRLEFDYDSHGRRIEKTASVWGGRNEKYKGLYRLSYFYDSWNLISEIWQEGKDSRQKNHLWGLDLSHSPQGAGGIGGLLFIVEDRKMDQKGKKKDVELMKQIPFCDGNGNIVGLASSDCGELTAHYTYGPFGELLSAAGPEAVDNAYRFSTTYADKETGCLYYGYRYYNPNLGRWISRDPIEERGGFNVTGFYLNDTVNFVDSRGQSVVRALITAGTAIVAAVKAAAKVCKKLRCKAAKHGPHHTFFQNGKRCWMNHVQVNCWFKGKPNSNYVLTRIKYGPCYKFKHGRGGVTH